MSPFSSVALLAAIALGIAACGGGGALEADAAGEDGGRDSGRAGAAGMDAAAGAAGAAGGAAGSGGAGADGAAGTGVTADAADAPAETSDGNPGDGDANEATDAIEVEPVDASTACDGEASCVAASLSGLHWELPCLALPSPQTCATINNTTQTAILAGANGTTYDVTLRFRGVVEQHTYTGGCAPGGGMWLAGGAVPETADLSNVYGLTISSPPQTYFLNAGASGINHVFAVDFQQTVRIDANARVTLFTHANDQQEVRNVGSDLTTPVTVTGTAVKQPYSGQFMQVDVVSTQVDPVPSTSAVGGGSGGAALSFDGSKGQRLTIADAASLRPASVTLESWFTMSAPEGSYAVLAGKGVGGVHDDSWAIWFESGALHTGVAVTSPAAAASVPWTPVENEWHHAAEVFDAAAMQNLLYVDGSLVSCTPGTPPVTYDANPMLVGADTDSGGIGGFWTGKIDEVRVFSTARTGAQIWADMHTHQLGPTTGLVGEWTFDEGTGQTAADQSGSNNPGTLGAAGTTETTDPTWVNAGAPY